MRHLAMLAFLVCPLAARAEPERTPDASRMHTDDCAKARKQHKTCVIDMGKGEEVNGNGVTPNGIGVAVIETMQHASLVQVRRDFIVEILKTAEDL